MAESAVAALGTNQRRSLRANLTKRNSQRYPGSPRIEITATPKMGAAVRIASPRRSGSQIGSRLRTNATAAAAPARPSCGAVNPNAMGSSRIAFSGTSTWSCSSLMTLAALAGPAL